MRMTTNQRARFGSAALAAAALAAVVAAAASPANAAPGQEAGGATVQTARRSLLLFPMDATLATIPAKDEVAAILTDVATSRLGASGAYSVTRFTRSLPTIARLHMDQVLTDADVSAPFSEDSRKAIKVAKEAGYEVAFVGSVDSYEYSDTDKQVTMVVSGRLLDVQTGKVLKSVIQTANSPKGGAGKEDEVAVATARSAAEQVMTKLVPAMAAPTTPAVGQNTTPSAEPKPRPRIRREWLLGILAVGLGIGLATR